MLCVVDVAVKEDPQIQMFNELQFFLRDICRLGKPQVLISMNYQVLNYESTVSVN